MSLADRFKELEDTLGESQVCKVTKVMADMDEQTQSAFNSILKSKVSNATISKELSNFGIEIGRTTIGLHRTNRCSCKETQ